jgi:hypothetical protein
MSESQRSPEVDPRRPLRARRQAAGIVAQYIHELTDREAETESADAAAPISSP